MLSLSLLRFSVDMINHVSIAIRLTLSRPGLVHVFCSLALLSALLCSGITCGLKWRLLDDLSGFDSMYLSSFIQVSNMIHEIE